MEKALLDFEAHKQELDKKEREGGESYGIEFMRLREFSQNLKSDPKYSTHEGEKPHNLLKNRYKDILPFDYCRVKLANGSDGDYINASFINSPTKQRYIAAQGPLPNSLEDFWTMVWENQVTTIVMACLEKEGFPPRPKCQRYWSNDIKEELKIGPFSIKLLEESVVPESDGSMTLKSLLVHRGSQERRMTHLHHSLWPDKLIPTCVSSILHLISTMRHAHHEDDPNPILVHCSAGCGRTGTIIAIDFIRTLLQTSKIPEDFNVFEIITEMRRQRTALVQTQEQYHYVHMAVSTVFKTHLLMLKNGSTSPKEQVYATVGSEFNGQQCRPPIKSPDYSRTLPSPHIDAIYSTVTKNISNAHRSVPIKYISLDDKNNDGDDTSSGYSRTLPAKVSVKNSLKTKHSNPSCEPLKQVNTGMVFRGYDIGYPNRVGKPQGPRVMTVTYI